MMIETEVRLFPQENNDSLSSDVNELAGATDGEAEFIPEGRGVAMETGRPSLAAHTGKLAIGVAATLGMMIYYNWRERRLAKQDPEGHARLKRLKAGVRNQDKAFSRVGTEQEKLLPGSGV